jgi:hypothetical protein
MFNDFDFADGGFEPSRFKKLPKKLNGHRLAYKGDAPSVKESQQEKAAAEVALKKWNYYQETYRPIEDQFMKNVDSMNSDGAKDFATGTAASAVTANFDNTRKQAGGSLRSAGINPNSGAYKSTMNEIEQAEAGASSDAKVRALNSVEDNYVTGLSNVSAIGRGQSTQAQHGLHDLAVGAQQKATQSAVDSFNRSSDNLNAAGSLAGAALYMGKNSNQSVTPEDRAFWGE